MTKTENDKIIDSITGKFPVGEIYELGFDDYIKIKCLLLSIEIGRTRKLGETGTITQEFKFKILTSDKIVTKTWWFSMNNVDSIDQWFNKIS